MASDFRHGRKEVSFKAGTHYPCSRLLFTVDTREHGPDLGVLKYFSALQDKAFFSPFAHICVNTDEI